ncbi:MAG: CmcJ/NvfI family oxidoreductase [Alphaproteobacteria bacterium]
MAQEHFVEATLNYRPAAEADIWFYDPGPGIPRTPEFDPHQVKIHDARAEGLRALIDRQGFELVACTADIVFNSDPALVRTSYYPAMERLVKEHLGAARVFAFDHDFRSTAVEQQTEHLRPAVMGVHNDYTELSGPQRVRELLPDEADTLLKRRFAFINVWKPIGHTAEGTPLAVCDAETIGQDDFTLLRLRYQHRTGQIYGAKYNPAQRWYYYPNMRTNEALLLKVFDSDKARARFLAHSAFVDPSARKDAPPRQSIEVRTIAFF